MKKIFLISALIACYAHSQPIPSSEETNATGYAYNENFCYGFAAPEGWYMDRATARKLGVGMVFLPEGTNWNNAKLAMYTRLFGQDGTQGEALIPAALQSVKDLYQQDNIDIRSERLDTLKSDSGEQGELWQLNIPLKNGLYEYVAYFPAGDTLSLFVIQVENHDQLDAAQHALRELARSYHRRSTCEPCSENNDTCQGT